MLKNSQIDPWIICKPTIKFLNYKNFQLNPKTYQNNTNSPYLHAITCTLPIIADLVPHHYFIFLIIF